MVDHMLADTLNTDRSHANTYYADIARQVIEATGEQLRDVATDDPVAHAKRRLGIDWILSRKTVLTELGRMMDANPNPTSREVSRFNAVVRSVADRHKRHTAKSACAYIRGRRLGETDYRDRVAALHHDLNAAINLHRQRYPESTWDDIRRALDLTAGQIKHKRS
jgi:hypothetical protein